MLLKYILLNYILCLLQGKFIRINFDVTGYIVGANIETCILNYSEMFNILLKVFICIKIFLI